MKIDNSIKSITRATTNEVQGPKASNAATPNTSAQGAKDSVQITSLSAQLHALESRLSDVSVVDSARVDAIKQAISEGRFKIDSEVVADRLLNTVKELVLNQKS